VVSVTNYAFFASPQPLQLCAYGVDVVTLGTPALNFTWIIGDTFVGSNIGLNSNRSWTPSKSSVYDGRVIVRDPMGLETSQPFIITVFLDSDGDGLHDEIEVAGNMDPNNEDSDGDYLSDYYEYNYSLTNSTNPDTDGDGLFDGAGPNGIGELVIGTNMRDNDTDDDSLLDGFEVLVGWNVTTERAGYSGKFTYHVTSDPLRFDTDGDRLNDSAEWEIGTDPRNKDTDGDGKSDLMESPWATSYDSDDDGVSDVYEEAGYDYWVNGIRQHATSNCNKTDTDDDGLSDWEERYPGADGYITAAGRADTDGDHLNDTMEMFTKTEAFGQRIQIMASTDYYQSYTLSARFGTYIADVKLAVGATTGEETEAGQNNSADFDAKIIYGSKEIRLESQSGVKYYFVNQNVSEVIGPNQGNGLWRLEIKSSKPAILDVFEIYGTIQLNPTAGDSDGDWISDSQELNATLNGGYITNPMLSDSDGDGAGNPWWNDYFEIYSYGTNPLVTDTDGDGVVDPADTFPRGNAAIRVSVLSGRWGDAFWYTPNLQVVTTVIDRAVATPIVTANQLPVGREIGFWFWYIKNLWDWPWNWRWVCRWVTIAAWTVCTQASFYQSYAFDIPDNQRYISMQTQLWNMWWPSEAIGDCILSTSFTYDVYNPGRKDIWSGSNLVSYDIQTFEIPRVHTIAVADPANFAQNKYNSLEHFNVAIFKVSGSNAHFANGYNAIVAPVSVFANSKLHAILEKAEGDSTILDANPVLKKFNFSGLDRSKATASKWLDSVFSGTEANGPLLTLSEAEAFLALFLTSANESEGQIYSASITNDAELLGLPADVLQVIPYDGNVLGNGAMGRMPRTLWGAIAEFFITLGVLLYGGLVFLVNFLIELGKWIAGVFGALVGAIAEAAMAIIEAVLKAAILIAAYILFAIDFLETTIMFALLGIGMLLFAALFGGESSFGLFTPFFIDLSSPLLSIYIYVSFDFIFVPAIDLTLPAKTEKQIINGLVLGDTSEVYLVDFLVERDSIDTNMPGEESVPGLNEMDWDGTISASESLNTDKQVSTPEQKSSVNINIEETNQIIPKVAGSKDYFMYQFSTNRQNCPKRDKMTPQSSPQVIYR